MRGVRNQCYNQGCQKKYVFKIQFTKVADNGARETVTHWGCAEHAAAAFAFHTAEINAFIASCQKAGR